MRTDGSSIRDAVAADAAAIARLHVEVWRETYRPMAPAAAYAALDGPRRLAQWQATLATPTPGRSILVADTSDGIVGFGMCGAATHPAFGDRAEIKNLYVALAQARRGIGRRLMAAMAARLAADGRERVALGVVVGNAAALAFYGSLGGRVVGEYADAGPLWPSRNLVVAWDDSAALLAATAS